MYVPSPVTAAVTSYSVQAPSLIASRSSMGPLNNVGCVAQVIPSVPPSSQLLSAKWTAGPSAVLPVLSTRSFTFWIDLLDSLYRKADVSDLRGIGVALSLQVGGGAVIRIR